MARWYGKEAEGSWLHTVHMYVMQQRMPTAVVATGKGRAGVGAGGAAELVPLLDAAAETETYALLAALCTPNVLGCAGTDARTAVMISS